MTYDPYNALQLVQALVSCPSVTPQEGGALDLLEGVLKEAGFATHRVPFSQEGTADVDNLYARYGTGSPHLCFAGHTDVVPVGDQAAWKYDPFSATIEDGILYGRGAEDMKGGVAAFAAAALTFLKENPSFSGSISFLITGDEEGPAINGTIKLLEWAKACGEQFDACVVGEPTNSQALGDTIKIGRRGSLTGRLSVQGKQGHVAYPHLAHNPIPTLHALLGTLIGVPFDEGTEHFQPTNLEVTTIDVGNGATNVIPAAANAVFNIRFNDTWTADSLKVEIKNRLASVNSTTHTLKFDPALSDVFLTKSDALTAPLIAAIEDVTGRVPQLSTGGGTSDARFIKNYCPVVEFGLIGKTMHQVDECIAVEDLQNLSHIYGRFIRRYFKSI